jgi:hypothetical protein
MIAIPPTVKAAAGVDGAGSVGTCATTGKIGLKPALVGFPNPDTSPPDTVKVQTKNPKNVVCTGTRTGDGANVVSASSKGGGTTPHSSCSALAGTTSSTLTLTVKWKTVKGTPKLNPSTITTTSQTGGVSGDGMHGTFDITGTVTAGSFTGDSVTAHVETDQLLSDVLAACNGKGIKKISFGANGASSVTIN